jgi:hypothetical protein
MLSYECGVIMKNGVLHFQSEVFRKAMHNVRTFETFWEDLLWEEESKKGHCKHCLSTRFSSEYDKS